MVTTDASGNASFAEILNTEVAADSTLTSTATGPNGTSEFSQCIVVLPGMEDDFELEFRKINRWVFQPQSRKSLLGIFIGSETQDVDSINIESLHLGDANPRRYFSLDINHDGYMDLVVAFKVMETGAACGDQTLELTGETTSGTIFTESQHIRTVGCNGSKWRKHHKRGWHTGYLGKH